MYEQKSDILVFKLNLNFEVVFIFALDKHQSIGQIEILT